MKVSEPEKLSANFATISLGRDYDRYAWHAKICLRPGKYSSLVEITEDPYIRAASQSRYIITVVLLLSKVNKVNIEHN